MNPINDQIYSLIRGKMRQNKDATDVAFNAFADIKRILQEMAKSLKHTFAIEDARLKISYTDRGIYEAEFKVADDILIFILHSNAFVFDSSHSIWKSGYVSLDASRGTCAMISVYNFLSDSFQFERRNEVGQMIARLFINRENHFFVEGKKQIGVLYNDYANQIINDSVLQSLIEKCILHSMEVDVTVPPIDAMREITVMDAMSYSVVGGAGGGKRLGFKFGNQNDDIEA